MSKSWVIALGILMICLGGFDIIWATRPGGSPWLLFVAGFVIVSGVNEVIRGAFMEEDE